MAQCAHWEAVSGISLHIQPSSSFPGYYLVTVVHTHAQTDVVVGDQYDALTWQEALSTIESTSEACRPGFRHARLQALQERLWPAES